MTDLKERIIAEIQDLDETALQEIYEIVRRIHQAEARKDTPLLERLSNIHIQGPEDFSENIDDFLNHRPHEE